MSIAISLKRVIEFTDEEKRRLTEMKLAVYPDRPGGYPETAREWTGARWGVFVTDESGELLSYTGLVTREAAVDGEPVLTGGVGGVATHPSHRGKGYAPLGIGRALDFLLGRDVDFALLVCRPELVGYYAKLGWKPFAGTLLVTQFGEPETFTFNEVMVGDLASSAPSTETIDLNGPPW
jgi:GNAT superfamily N-acetyltransferase